MNIPKWRRIFVHFQQLQGQSGDGFTVTNFMADGSDQFYVLKQGTNRLGGAIGIDLDTLGNYFSANDLR